MAVFDNSGSQGPRRKPKRKYAGSAATDRNDRLMYNALNGIKNALTPRSSYQVPKGVQSTKPINPGGWPIMTPRGGASRSKPPSRTPVNPQGKPLGNPFSAGDFSSLSSRLAAGSRRVVTTAKPKPKPVGRVSAKPVQNRLPVVSGSSANAAPVKVTGGGGKPVVAGGAKTTSTASSATSQMQSFIDKARASVSADDLPKLNALQRQLDSLNRSGEKDIRSTRNGVEAQQLAYDHLYGKLGEFQGSLKDAQQKNYEALEGKTNANYDRLLQSITGNYDAARQSTTSEAERLGLGSQVPVSTAGQVQDQSFLQGLAGVDKQHYSTQMAQSGSDFSQVMDMMRNNTARENVSAQRQAGTQGELAIQEIMNQLREGRFDIEGQQGDIRATQGQRARELAEGLEDKDYSRRADAQQTAFSQWLARENFKMDKTKFDTELEQLKNPAGPSESDILAVTKQRIEVNKLLGLDPNGNPLPPNAGKPAKRTPEQEGKYILHRALNDPKNAAVSKQNMDKMWEVIETLRNGNYDGDNVGDLSDPKNVNRLPAGKFDPNDRTTLAHLDLALRRRFPAGDVSRLKGTALDIIRALTGKL